MGALGSGRRYKRGEVKPVVEDQISINILDLKKRTGLSPEKCLYQSYSIHGREIGWLIISPAAESLGVDYCFNSKLQHQTIQLATITPGAGGKRRYLICPACNSRREMLYYADSDMFACRECHGLAYRSTQLNAHQRHSYMAQKYTEQLGGLDYIRYSKKPPGMWNRTFLRLQQKVSMHRIKSCKLFIEHFNRLSEEYGSVMAGH